RRHPSGHARPGDALGRRTRRRDPTLPQRPGLTDPWSRPLRSADMKIDGSIGFDLHNVPANARDAEAAGYSGVWSAETSHDPFFPLLLAAEHTTKLELGTSIAVAFARSPMTLANVGYDLQAYSKGRFNLGLGSQIKPHIEKRFSMPWSHPAPRMREFVQAMRAIWDSWMN